MRLFFKHLLRSIVKKPLQPVILLVTLMLAMAVSIMSFTMKSGLDQETNAGQQAKYGNAHLTLSLNGDSTSRFMFASDVEEVLLGEADAVGAFELPMLYGEEKDTVFGVATEFSDVGEVFDFRFNEYGKITPSSLGYSALITEKLAKEKGLGLGDKFNVLAFGGEKEYEVAGIAPHRFMDAYDVMVDITGVVRLLADGSPLLSALGDSFKPCSTIYVRILGEDIDEEILEKHVERLQADERFADKTLVEVSGKVFVGSNIKYMSLIMDVASLLSLILAGVVTFCCFYVLAHERTNENRSFTLSGAKPWMLHLMQYLEVCIYWLVGGGVGTLLSIPLVRFMVHWAGFEYVVGSIALSAVLKAGAFLLLSVLATATLFIYSQRRKKKKAKLESVGKSVYIVCGVALLIYGFVFVAPMKIRGAVLIAGMVALVFAVFLVVPPVLKGLMRVCNRRFEERYTKTYHSKALALRYAVKNVYSVKILHNIVRLITVLTVVVLGTVLIVISTYGHVSYVESIFNGEYAVLNATESCQEKVLSCDLVDNSYKVYIGTAKLSSEKDSSLNAFSADEVAVYSPHLHIQTNPSGNQAVVSLGVAKQYLWKVGDVVTVELEGEVKEIVISNVVDAGFSFMALDCEYFGVSRNVLIAKGVEGASSADVLSQLTDATAVELAAIVSVKDLFKGKLATIDVCLKLGVIALLAVVVFSTIGMLDNLYESYRARRSEFALFRHSGMSKKMIRKMKSNEITLTLGLGVLFGLIIFVFYSMMLNAGLYAFRYATFLNFLHFFH